jgi:AcrR family transcriptional regulator
MPTARLTGQERRAAIIETAINLFAEKGFRGVTTRELAQAVGVSEPVLYQHFPSKRDLYNAIIETIVENSESSFGDWPDILSRLSDNREFFTTVASAIIDWHERHPAYLRLLLFSALEGHEFSEIFFERHSVHFFNALADHIRTRVETGAFRCVDPLLAAHHFIGVTTHYGINCSIFQKGKVAPPRDAVISSIVDIFMKGILA